MSSDETAEIIDRPDRHRYEILVGGRRAGVALYELDQGVITLTHTRIAAAFAGRGMGRRLASGVLDDARARGLLVRPRCPFMAGYIAAHREYEDLIADPPRADGSRAREP